MEKQLVQNGTPYTTAHWWVQGSRGAILGHAVATEWFLSGIGVYLHEVPGHIYAGGHLIRDYQATQLPSYHIGAFEKFHDLFDSKGPVDFIKNIYHWQIGHLTNNNGVAGWTKVRTGAPNPMGRAMGTLGRSAWTAFTGSLPALVLDTTAGVGGIHLKERHPFIGYFLITFALVDHLIATAYPWHGVFQASLSQKAAQGHDFARIATSLGALLSCSPRYVAVTVAVLHTLSVPLALLLAELRVRGKRTKLISNAEAAKHLINNNMNNNKYAEERVRLFSDYPRITELLDNSTEKEEDLFYNYLGEMLPNQSIQEAKREILEQRQIRPATWSQTAALLSVAASVATKISYLLSTTAFARLAPVTTTLSYVTPMLSLAAPALAMKEAINDYRKSSNPKALKVLSTSKAALLGISSLGLMFSKQHLGLYSASLAISTIAPIVLDFAIHQKQKIPLNPTC